MDVGNLSSGQKDELMDQVRQQIAVANAQELLTVSTNINTRPNLNVAGKCFLTKLIPFNSRKWPKNASRNAWQNRAPCWTVQNRYLHNQLNPITQPWLILHVVEMHRYVYGPLHGLLELGIPNIWPAITTRADQHVKITLSSAPRQYWAKFCNTH